ncbi:hypothetical protein FKM82_027025, partial [Ascaphus truei]
EIEFEKKEEDHTELLKEKDRRHTEQINMLHSKISNLEKKLCIYEQTHGIVNNKYLEMNETVSELADGQTPGDLEDSQLLENVVPDFDVCVGETQRLDTSAHRAKAQLALKVKRQPPSRNKLKESFISREKNISMEVR